MVKSYLPYGRQFVDKSDIEAVEQALKGEIITRGKHVELFEAELAQLCGAKYVVAFNSGTAALQACYFAAKTNHNDRILTTPNSFFATSGVALQSKSRIVFVDIETSTGNIDLEKLELNLNQPSTRGRDIIVPVHFAGRAVNMEALNRLIRSPETVVIEDAAHAIGSFYPDGSPVGSCLWSDMTIFSFHPVKNITTGEGGAVTTNDATLYHELKRFRNNGIERDPAYLDEQPAPWYYEVHAATGNYNFTDMQAALGSSQLKKLPIFVEKRRALVKKYREGFRHARHIKLLDASQDENTAFHIFPVQIDFAAYRKDKAKVMQELQRLGIGSQVHYIPIYRHPAMKQIVGDICEYFPEMERYYAETLTLPLYYELELDDVDYVVDNLMKILKARG